MSRTLAQPDFAAFTPADWSRYYVDQADSLIRRAERENHAGRRASLYTAAAEMYEHAATVRSWPTV
jgi:hypothetical protein